ncbi:alpha-2-macroglobulin family protein [Agriterribacter sp.]|uniref:alpha-2-macroglobulin family protein n=1 Tax=Agriterribacter sp. TaxID=2821509 RepID=UPI002B9BBAE0|nr:MG2 domain-containing protein [Agriterribacter sp.]HTN08911.1 MG2 domain-containing protein [Agriterribacter sp.]
MMNIKRSAVLCKQWYIPFLLISVLIFACAKKEKITGVDPAFSRYIDGYTSGVISKAAAIRVRLAAEAPSTHALNEALKDPLFSFSPSVKGKAYWVDARTIEFKPDEYLTPGQLYTVNFKLSKATAVPDAFQTFTFNVQAVTPGFRVKENGLKTMGNSKEMMLLNGVIETADIESSAIVEKLLTAGHQGQSPVIKWEHNQSTRTHCFTIEDIKRGAGASLLKLQWDGAPLGLKEKGSKEIEIPAVGDFKVLNIRAVQETENFVLVQCSEAIATSQQLNGLITVSNKTDLSYSIDGSEVKLYVPDRFDGNYTVTVNGGIQSIWNNKLNKAFTANLFFENRLPSVTIRGRGVILPNSGKLVLPFETINLSAVDISIIKVYENNIPQFFQSNSYDGEYDLRRVATPVVQQTLRLDNDKTLDLHRKQKFSLDIDKYLKAETGAIYHVTIGFRPEYSLYTCRTTDKKSEAGEDEYDNWYSSGDDVGLDNDDGFWKIYNAYYPYGYNWNQRDNPCSPSYYNKERWASRNIIASNIGLTAKRANDNSMLVAVTDILSAKPMSEVELELLDYQQQVLFTTKSDKNGLANFDLKKKPYLLVAKKGSEKGYLKLDDGSSLPLSRFDVSGVEVKNGLKGFIFGERGVWRPGDTMYINFIVEDKAGKLPKDHPVELNLITPQGQLYKRMVETSGEHGFYLFATSTDASSPTGNWLARIKVGGAVFEKRLKVETVMPNRLKIDLDFGRDPVLGKDGVSHGTLKSQWLFGTPARNLAAKIDASLYARKTVFKKYPNYHFDDPTAGYATETKTIFDGRLNEEGAAAVNTTFGAIKNAPGMLSASLLVKVFEPGGAFSADNRVIPYSPYKSYAGINMPEGQKPWGFLLTDKTYELPVVNVDANGNALSGTQQMEVELYRVSWRWWWDNTGDGFSNFTQDTYNKLLKKDTVRLTNGVGKWHFSAPGSEWGRYLVLVRDGSSGHTTGQVVYFDDPWWQARGNAGDPSAAAMLSFTSGKEKYNVGEAITLQIPGSKGGRALISIESGSRVIKTDWIETQEGQTVYTFKAEAGMAPNIYANVSLLQPHAQTVNDLPVRMYGVIPILIEDKNTVIKPVIHMPDVIRPEQQTAVTVSETLGKAMTYCVAIVDEGLLDLTRFKTPNPHDAFYAREALGVKSWDIFDHVIGAWGAELERILTIGGDEEASGGAKEKKVNRFKPVVKYLGPFHLKKGQKQTHNFQLPPYIGSVRAMVVAAGEDAYGFAEKTIAVKKPLMLLGTLPRVLGPTETIQLPVTVFAMENNIRNVTVTLQSNAYMETVGSASQQVSFTSPGEKMVYFDVKVKANTGIGKVKLTALGGAEKAEYEVELDVRNPNPIVTHVTERILNPAREWNETVIPVGIPANGKATLEISSIPPVNLEKRLDYLIQYPHGCIEQITSAVFPQLVLSQLMDLSDRKKAETERNIRAGIERYKNFQLPDGGFSYWPGLTESDEWGTSYAGHFLLKAREKGYIVPTDLIQQWLSYQRGKANAWAPSATNFYGGDLTQSYRLYLLALAQSPELGAMNRLKEFKYLSPEAKWRLAAAYQLTGQQKVASDLITGLPTTFEERKLPGISYGSGLRDQAMVLETLTLMNKRKEAAEVLRSVSARLATENWYSTQTTAYSLVAIAAYCGTNASGEKIIASASVNGKNVNINAQSYITQIPVSVTDANKKITVTNKGTNILYARLITQGQPVTGEDIQVNSNADVLSMNVSYMSLNGNPIAIESIAQGTDFVAKVTVRNPGIRGKYNNMTLSQIFPGGWEILNTRMLDNEGSFKSSPFSYQDIRDDRVYTHFNMKEGETLTYYVMLNAAYAGKYFLPGVYCEAMYDNTISAGVKGRWVEVK